MGLLLKSQKSVTSNNIFHFVTNKSHDIGVSYAHRTSLLILIFYIFNIVIVSNLLIPTKRPKKMQSYGDSRGGEPLKSNATTSKTAIDLDSHISVNFSHDRPL